MNRVRILDCTLRDGGYINSFKFGKHVIMGILDELANSKIDIIECGFLQSGQYDDNLTLFSDVSEIRRIIPKKENNVMYVALVQYGKISVDEIKPNDGTSIDGIRVAFHAAEIEGSILLARALMNKGYKIFMQTVGTTSYSDRELLDLIMKINELRPYAFYFVDTLGMMYQKDIKRLFYLIDNNLEHDIQIGFHAHNNLQQAFSNAVELLHMDSTRKLIIDSSVQGMGRGAGNLCTELILQYVNENIAKKYEMLPILNIIDSYISPLRVSFDWGYSAAYFLSATKYCHPNYAKFLINKQTLKSKDINRIIDEIDASHRDIYDEEYILDIYTRYKSRQINDDISLNKLRYEIGNRKVIVVAPGKSASSLPEQKWEKLSQTGYIITVNFLSEAIPFHRAFFSNEKRYADVESDMSKGRLIVTSNIFCNYDGAITVNYDSYLNEEPAISDNAGLMCINVLKQIGIKEIGLIGFDGFTHDQGQNYSLGTLPYALDKESINDMNLSMTDYFVRQCNDMDIEFITDSQYNPLRN